MFKFLKELIGAFNEGIVEAKQELAQEALEDKLKLENEEAQILLLTHTETFGTALGAPFRTGIFGDWFSLFGKAKEDERKPAHLYTFGTYSQLEENKKKLIEAMNRDFGIEDYEMCIIILTTFFDLAGIDKSATVLMNEDDEMDEDLSGGMWDISLEGVDALVVTVISHIITASTDVGYLKKEDALILLDKLKEYVKTKYRSWSEFSAKFLVGEKNVGLNNALGRNILAKNVNNLMERKGSPWNNIPW